MIQRDSRYFTGPLVQIVDSRGGDYTIAVLRKAVGAQRVSYRMYTWTDGDQLDAVAAAFLGDPKLWYKILDLNPQVPDMFSLKPGMQIRIPNG